jgi:TPR repeat protein
MATPMTKRGWRNRITFLRRRAVAGDLASIRDLGLDLLDGIQDKKGRTIVRRNPRAAFRLLRRAAQMGDVMATSSVGYAYDHGLGTNCDRRQALRWYRRAADMGSTAATTNIATIYRDARKFRLAFLWWKRSADMNDGDAMVDVGYCYQYGIGVRRNPLLARRMLRRASISGSITEYGREEALYHLALEFIDRGKVHLAIPLLSRAAADGDFPEASSVMEQIRSKSAPVPCRCRRHIYKHLPGHAKCPYHFHSGRSR